MTANEPPVIDFAPFYGPDSPAKDTLVRELRQACEEFGFFQLINHGIPSTLQESILAQSREFFDLPLDIKEKYSKDKNPFNRGYERLRSQNFEKRDTLGDLKEGFYLGRNRALDEADVVARKFGQGPNMYPRELGPEFRDVTETYHAKMMALAEGILRMLARTLGLNEDVFEKGGFVERPIAVLRLLRYPAQESDAGEGDLERGIGAHTDFGAVTILLQDDTGGLQVWDNISAAWVDVTPIPGAYVVNLGNMMMRWTNDRYLSNLHRVINKSGKERFSVPFFFSGNPDYSVACLPSCEGRGAKYPPVTVGEWIRGRYADTYGEGKGGVGELRRHIGVDGGR
ncbi:putative oxidoreductase [Aspergillus filifer]